MPYKRVGKTVYIKKSGKWHVLKTHPSTEKAISHLKALNINVMKKEQ